MKYFLSTFLFFTVVSSVDFIQSQNKGEYNLLVDLAFVSRSEIIVTGVNSTSGGKIILLSSTDGTILKDMLLSGSRIVKSLKTNHFGTNLIILTGTGYGEKNYDSLISFSLIQNKILWKIKWEWESSSSTVMEYSNDDKEIVVVTSYNILIFKDSDGSLISNECNFIDGFSSRGQIVKTISNNGKYLAYYQKDVVYEHSGFLTDFILWLFGIEDQYDKIRLWDIFGNKLIYELELPQHDPSIAFFADCQKVVIGNFTDNTTKIYDINDSLPIKKWNSTFPGEQISYSPWYAIVSNKGEYYLNKFSNKLILWNLNAINITRIYTISIDIEKSLGSYRDYYPMAFDNGDEKILFQENDKLKLFSLKDWKLLWSTKWID